MALPLFFFQIFTFVVQFLTFRNANFDFDPRTRPVE
ncbi:Uncharacterised protein [Vibrio cholerae]|nr:Uncharacterised protein [Vibrio cholerae]